MRKISEVSEFPFLSKAVRYYEVANSELCELSGSEKLLKDAYFRAVGGESKLYATWHGTYRTDMFAVDDLHAFGAAFSFERSHEHKIVWHCKNPDEQGPYVTVDVEFACGCTFDTPDGTQKLKNELMLCKGWEMSAAYGRNGHGGKYSVRIRKSSMHSEQ